MDYPMEFLRYAWPPKRFAARRDAGVWGVDGRGKGRGRGEKREKKEKVGNRFLTFS